MTVQRHANKILLLLWKLQCFLHFSPNIRFCINFVPKFLFVWTRKRDLRSKNFKMHDFLDDCSQLLYFFSADDFSVKCRLQLFLWCSPDTVPVIATVYLNREANLFFSDVSYVYYTQPKCWVIKKVKFSSSRLIFKTWSDLFSYN